MTEKAHQAKTWWFKPERRRLFSIKIVYAEAENLSFSLLEKSRMLSF